MSHPQNGPEDGTEGPVRGFAALSGFAACRMSSNTGMTIALAVASSDVSVFVMPSAGPRRSWGACTCAVLRHAPASHAAFGEGPVLASYTPDDGWRVHAVPPAS